MDTSAHEDRARRASESASESDAWLEAARAMRKAALGSDEVAALRGSARFETRGRGEPVAGVALRGRGSRAEARLGIVLGRAVLDDGTSLQALTQTLRTRLRHAWEDAGHDEPLTQVELHLLDIAGEAKEHSAENSAENAAETPRQEAGPASRATA